jgi:L-iditol 2-dehydrogenase
VKALVKFAPGYGNLEIREIEDPKIGPDEVLVEVKSAGICGSDLQYYEWRTEIKTPIVLGHEFAGPITEVGERVRGWRVGDRIASETSARICGECYYCRHGDYNLCKRRKGFGSGVDGAFTQYVAVPARLLHRIPSNLTYDEAAVVQPCSDIVHAVSVNAEILPGDTVVVLGSGPMGLLTMQVARARGAGRVIVTGLSIDESRLNIAKQIGADVTINIQDEDPIKKISGLTDGMGADVVFEVTGSGPAMTQALDMVRRKGQIVVIGVNMKPVSLDSFKILENEITIRGSSMSNWDDYERAIGLISRGQVKIKPLITHKFPITAWDQAFKLLVEKKAGKVLFTPV